MGTSLNGLTPANTYKGLIKTTDNTEVDATLKALSDGDGNDLPLLISTTSVTNLGGGTASGCTAFGDSALLDNLTGTNNTAIGKSALENNTASNNTAVGFESANANTAATGITAIGYQALKANSTSNLNTAVGFSSQVATTSGGGNTSVGANCMLLNTNGQLNTAVGANALEKNISGGSNVAIGRNSSLNNDGSDNTAIGFETLLSATSSFNVIAIGSKSLRNNTASNNTAVGFEAGYNVTTGENNTLLGKDAGKGITTGSGNTIIGPATGLDSALTNHIVLADGAGNQRVVINSSGDVNLNGNKLTNFIPRTQAGGTLTIDSTNQDTYCGGVFEVTGAVNITIANSVRDGFSLSVIQMDANQCTFLASGGSLVLRNRQSHTQSAGQWATCSLFKNGNNLILAGDTA